MIQSKPREAALPGNETAPYPSDGYAWCFVLVLLGIYINSFLDRQILALLVGPIRETFGVSDSALGMLQGIAFALLYCTAGLPLGFLADRLNRRLLIFWGQIVWTLGSVAFGLGNRFGQVFAARVVVGVGEATLSPAAYSLIADLFRPDRLGRALSLYGMGIYIGSGLAYLLGGYAVQWMGVGQGVTYDVPLVGRREAWQMVFFVIAAPTVPLSLMLLLLREPARRGQAPSAEMDAAARYEFFRWLRVHWGTMALHTLGFACIAAAGYGAGAWNAEYFVRVHGMERGEVGKLLGWITLGAGPIGIYFGGWLGDRLTRAGRSDGKICAALISLAVWVPFGIAYPLVSEGWLAAVLLVGATFGASMPWGLAPAAIQEVAPPRVRGQASAVYLFVNNIIGLGLGPYLVAVCTDRVFQDDLRVNDSLVLVGAVAAGVAAISLSACRPMFRRSMQERA